MSKVEKVNLLNKISHFADVLFVVFYFLSLLFEYKQNAEIELKKEIQIPIAPNFGTNTVIYASAPKDSIINVPKITFLTNAVSPDSVLRLNAS